MTTKKPAPARAKRSTSPRAPRTHDEILAGLPAGQRAALEGLRQQIREIEPEVEECVSYGLPAFRLKGRFFVAYGAWKNHCAFYPGGLLKLTKEDLQGVEMAGKGTIRFAPDGALPVALLRRVIALRKERVLADASGAPRRA